MLISQVRQQAAGTEAKSCVAALSLYKNAVDAKLDKTSLSASVFERAP